MQGAQQSIRIHPCLKSLVALFALLLFAVIPAVFIKGMVKKSMGYTDYPLCLRCLYSKYSKDNVRNLDALSIVFRLHFQ